MKKHLGWIGWGLVVVLLGCADESPQSQLFSREQPDYPSPFQRAKVQLSAESDGQTTDPNQSAAQFQNPLNQWSRYELLAIEPGTRLVGIIDNHCLDANLWSYEQELSRRITQFASQPHPQLAVQAYGFEAEESMALQDLERQAQLDSCVRGIVSDTEWELLADRPTINDARADEQEFHQTIASTEGWNFFYQSKNGIKSGTETIVAVVDTGVDSSHEDLKNVMWQNADGEFGVNMIDDTPPIQDDVGHGTHVAGLIAAEMGNGVGVAGVAGGHSKIMAVKVFTKTGRTTTEAIINGIRWAVDNGAEVINLSLGGPRPNAGMLDVLQYAVEKGVVVMVAAGNNGRELGRGANIYPAMYGKGLEGVITVGSIHSHNGKLSGFSNRSTEYVELAAPGSYRRRWWGTNAGIYSTLPNDRYGRMAGTSMATPVAAGAASLIMGYLKSNALGGTPASVESVLLQGSLQDPQLLKQVEQGRRLDLQKLSQVL